MARNPTKASQGKRAKKSKMRDLPARKKARGVKGGAFISSYQPQKEDLRLAGPDTLTGGQFTCIPTR